MYQTQPIKPRNNVVKIKTTLNRGPSKPARGGTHQDRRFKRQRTKQTQLANALRSM